MNTHRPNLSLHLRLPGDAPKLENHWGQSMSEWEDWGLGAAHKSMTPRAQSQKGKSVFLCRS